jgi:unsaturated rhamnogalacturonyl hydrolase
MNPLEISRRLYDHYESIEEVKHYYGLLAIYALVLTAETAADEALAERCRKILRRFPDEVEHPRYNFQSYTIGGVPRAYWLWKGLMDDERSRRYVRDYAEELMKAPRDPAGILVDPYHEGDWIWIDVAMPVTPYLLFAGLAFGEDRYVEEAARQSFLMYDDLVNTENGLLHQCKNFTGPGRYTEDHWGRGNGWGFIALTELVQHLPADSPHRPRAERYFIEHARALLPHQSARGFWRQEIPHEKSYEESSATGLILYGLGVGLRLGLLDRRQFEAAFARGLRGLAYVAINPDFSIELSCPGCRCPGAGREKGTVQAYMTLRLPYRDEHHGFAPLMLAMVEAARAGMDELPLAENRSSWSQRADRLTEATA